MALEDLATDFGWVVLGFIVSLFFSPLFSGKVVKLYERAGIYSPPPLTVSARFKNPGFNVGSTVEAFGGTEWQDSFGIYTVTIQNDGEKRIEHLRTELFFPGIVRAEREPNTGGANFQILNRRVADATIDGVEGHVAHCSQKITAEDIHPGEGLIAEFLVDHDFTDYELIHDFNPDPEFQIDFRWNAHGYPFKETQSSKFQNADQQYAKSLVRRGIQLRDQNADPKGAMADFNDALEIFPDFPPALYEKGLTHFQAGDERVEREYIEEAISYFEKTIQIDPNHLPSHKQLMACYLWLMNTELRNESNIENYRTTGLEYGHAAMEIAPEDSDVQSLLKELKNFEPEHEIDPDNGELSFLYKPSDSKEPGDTILFETTTDDGNISIKVEWTGQNELKMHFATKNRAGDCSVPMDGFDTYDKYKITGSWNLEGIYLEVNPLDQEDVSTRSRGTSL